MSNIKFHSNRQVALQMAIEFGSATEVWPVTTPKDILKRADIFYEWLQDAPMKDEDQRVWLDGWTTKTKPKDGNQV